jgi:N-acetylneuraminic acid mutarotase
MVTKRGCFSALYHEGFVFVFGGLNYIDKVMRKCERYSIENNAWKNIADMHEPRKHASACALTTDTIYVFGGTTSTHSTDTIE